MPPPLRADDAAADGSESELDSQSGHSCQLLENHVTRR